MSIDYELLEDGIHVITLNRPQSLNALDIPAKEALGAIWRQATGDPAVKVLLLRGAGEKAFCAGSDIKEMQRTGRMVTTDILMDAIPSVGVALEKPVVAVLHGFTIGMGLTLAIHSDFRIAAPGTRLGFPETQHGMLSGVSAVTLPGIVGEAAALDLMLTGRIVDSEEALRIGLVHKVVDDPWREGVALARRLASNSTLAVALTKRLVLAERARRTAAHASMVDAARLEVTASREFGDVVAKKIGAGRARE